MKHSSIIPLIGGETIAVEQATGVGTDHVLSFDAFKGNDSHLLNYFQQHDRDVPYHSLDSGAPPFTVTGMDSVSSVCPCAGLSSLSTTSSPDNEKNEWMYRTAEYVLSEMKPGCYWGENAPALYTDKGTRVRNTIIEIGKKNGYTASFYRTKSLLHGVPQVRNRSFFFLWRGDRAPVFEYFNRPWERIEDLIVNARGNTQTEPINAKAPSSDPFYAYILNMHGGITHREFIASRKSSTTRPSTLRGGDVLTMILDEFNEPPEKVRDWLKANGHDKHASIIQREIDKKAVGLGTMRRNTILPLDYIGAFVGHYPMALTHPTQDRYVTYRESMAIMGLPSDFELLNAKRSVNHICQNVPVPTARDMATEVMIALGTPDAREWRSGTVMQNNTTRRLDTVDEAASSLENFF